MAANYKDYMIRWGFKASWSFLEAALILNEINPETSNPKPVRAGDDKVSTMHFWLVKQHKQGLLPTDGKKPLRSSPGDIIRLMRANDVVHSQLVAQIWEVARYQKNNRRILTDLSWTVYAKAIEIILKKHPSVTKEQIVVALYDLPRHYTFPSGLHLMPYSKETLRRKLRKTTDNKAGRPKKEQLVEIDVPAISKQISL